MASTEIKDALRTAANAVAKYIQDASKLAVETQTVIVGDRTDPVLAARTVIALDGDNCTVIPAVHSESGKLEVDTVLYDLHMQNVQSAIDYRSKMMNSLLGLLRSPDKTT